MFLYIVHNFPIIQTHKIHEFRRVDELYITVQSRGVSEYCYLRVTNDRLCHIRLLEVLNLFIGELDVHRLCNDRKFNIEWTER